MGQGILRQIREILSLLPGTARLQSFPARGELPLPRAKAFSGNAGGSILSLHLARQTPEQEKTPHKGEESPPGEPYWTLVLRQALRHRQLQPLAALDFVS